MTRAIACIAALWLLTVAAALPVADADPHSLSARAVRTMFATSDNCIACHNGLVTQEGEDVSIGRMWRSTMMANAARDPYFHAGVRREITDHPTLAAEIQDE